MKNTIVIGIHSGKYISLATYLKAWKVIRAMSEDTRRKTELKDSLTTWYAVSAQDCLNQYIAGVHDRINLRASEKCLISSMLKTPCHD